MTTLLALPLRPPDPPAFDLHAPLPQGVTLLEASAGTGKTYTIAALTARYVAAGVPLDQLLVVTFTRMATGELRDRVRERLVSAAEGLARVGAGGGAGGDELVEVLADAEAGELRERAGRLDRAVAEFDAATIDTTHGFCLQVLSGLGVTGDVEPSSKLVEQVEDLLDEVVDDLYVRRFVERSEARPFRRAEARRIAAAALGNPGARVVPEPSTERTPAAMRRRLVVAVCEEIDGRKRAAGLLTYDDLLTRLRDTLADPSRGEAACRRLRARYRVVLVDEFQDTDPVQWEILRRAFAEGGTTLVLIGDPKQAVYAFRGADVFAYLDAARQATTECTLRVNWRSDQGLLDALDVLFAGCQLGHPGIVHRRVESAPGNRLPRLESPQPAPLRFRVLERRGVELTKGGYAAVGSARPLIAEDLARQVEQLLGCGGEVLERAGDGTEAGRRPVRPGDLAVLVRSNLQARVVREALARADIPAVLGGGGSVFSTAPAEDWLRLLEALERPTARERAAAAALTGIVGWSAADVAEADDAAWEDFHWQLHRWASVLKRRGVATLVELVTASQGIPERLLGRRGGERILTDLRHVGQLLHEAATTEGLGPTSLVGWLRKRIDDAERDVDDADRTLRLESDSEAVQVLTIHRSKGLEFPVVFCPFLWDSNNFETTLPVFHDPAAGDARTLDVGGEGPDFEEHKRLHRMEERGEDLRLLYVALTRARHQAVVWWAGGWSAGSSSLGRLLVARDAGGVVRTDGPRNVSDREVLARLAALADEARGTVSVELVPLGEEAADGEPGEVPPAPGGDGPEPPALEAATFDRLLDRAWRRTSFSAITARSHVVPLVGSEPDEPAVTDEAGVAGVAGAGAAGPVGAAGGPGRAGVPAAVGGPGGAGGPGPAAPGGPDGGPDLAGAPGVPLPSPLLLGPMPGGVRVGTLVHRVLEGTDFAAPDLTAELRRAIEAAGGDPAELGDPDLVVAGLEAAIDAPLGPLAGGLRLRDLGRRDRVDEMTFELPLAGGEMATGRFSPADVADLLRAQSDGRGFELAYADRLADPTLETGLRGYLTGSLDVVLRIPGPRYLIADYKTNRLAGPAEELTTWHYRPEAVEAEMLQAHYPLQAILYTVALHRYLRWRQPGYRPEQHLGGVLYLFVRGMSAEQRPAGGTAPGVWSWRPPAGLVEGLSDLFDEGAGA